MKIAVTQLISPFAACRFSRLSSCISKEGPRSLVLSSLLPYLTYQGIGVKHCNTCVIERFRGITEVLGRDKNGRGLHPRPRTNSLLFLPGAQALFGMSFIIAFAPSAISSIVRS